MNWLEIVTLCLSGLLIIVEVLKTLFIGGKLKFICRHCGVENEVEVKPLLHYVIGGCKIQAENLEDAVKQFNESYLSLLEKK